MSQKDGRHELEIGRCDENGNESPNDRTEYEAFKGHSCIDLGFAVEFNCGI